jgi:hypothetical protein
MLKLAILITRLWYSYIKKIKINYESLLLIDSMLNNEIKKKQEWFESI